MRKISFVTGYFLLAVSLTGCSSIKSVIRPTASVKSVNIATLTPYSGPKAKIAVADFNVLATKASNEIGLGLREIMVGTLIKSNRFSVIEPQAGPADLIITVAVIEFEPEGSGGRAGLGGGGGVASGRLGGLLGASLNKAHMALDIRIVDPATSGVIAANRVQGQASDISGSNTDGLLNSSAEDKGLSAYANTPMEKAINVCIIEAVRYISKVIPTAYYKY